MAGHKNEIPLENGEPLADDSFEVLRVWVTNKKGSSVWIDAGLVRDPHAFGRLMANTLRHAASAYSDAYDMTRDEALQKMVDGAFEQLRDQADQLKPAKPGILN